jgi:hypothetical protein
MISLLRFKNPEIYSTYNSLDVGTYQVDLMSLSKIYSYFGYETNKGIRKPKGPWVIVCIDIYSRFIQMQYIGFNTTMRNIIKHLKKIFRIMGNPGKIEVDNQFRTKLFIDFCKKNNIFPFFYKPEETNKNAVVESNIRVVKNMIIEYITDYGFPSDDKSIQKMLDAISWTFNRRYKKSIQGFPILIFKGLQSNKQKIIRRKYDVIPNGTIVVRKPQPPRSGSVIYGRTLDVDPEPFVVVNRTGRDVGLYEIKSMVTGIKERKWYKPYELHIVPEKDINDLIFNDLTIKYLEHKYGTDVTEKFLEEFPY